MRTIIVDDELPAVRELKFLLSKYPEIEIIGEAYDGEDALELIKKQKPDIVFLDIHMTNRDGIATARELITLKSVPFIVFATGYDQYALQAFELNATDYLLKPFREERIEATIVRIMNQIEKKKTMAKGLSEKDTEKLLHQTINLKLADKLAVWEAEKIKIIDYHEILYISVDGRQCTVHTQQENYMAYMNLKDLESKLPKDRFLRTHRAYIVNLSNIDEIKLWFNHTFLIQMKNCKDQIPVSRTYIKGFRNAIGL
ncbi:DNA-binding LytR/AlgR family response regulator [Anaerosolibacter carboniphilus]|uniref:Stage 0 sporulation protein A homolog n=1 Tax=Anaerosolibacter carboniphilus TaxID=1417629 RepID=A0A841KWA9_9FIRM|nr:LytTR family DNA-binding domain-containing protein [Anaerosolibacter carboniphilus]MBB6217731.1 DNA-binding LytR/AlgR family response regulator [Anaerosolibacter carboniphilus]